MASPPFSPLPLLAFFLLSTSPALAGPVSEGLLANGNFEEPPAKNNLKKTEIVGKDSLPSWEINGLVEFIKGGPQPGGMFFPVAHGVHAVQLGNDASISQTINVKKESLYALTFAASKTCAQEEFLAVLVTPGQKGGLSLQTLYSSDGSDVYAFGFVASADSVKVSFSNPGVKDDPACGPLLDAVAIKELITPVLTNDNLVTNPSFEVGPYRSVKSTNGVLIPPKQDQDLTSPLPGWIVDSLKAVKFIDSKHFRVPVGLGAVELLAGKESSIGQTIKTTPDKSYSLTFKVGDAKNGCVGSMMVEAFAGQDTIKVPFQSEGKGTHTSATLKFKATSPTTRITFLSSNYHTKKDDMGSFCGPVLDDVWVVPAS